MTRIAGVLIIWDRMFGTFRDEDMQLRSYGLAKPLQTFNPILANIEHFKRISPWLLLKRRVKHGNVFQISNLFDNISTSTVSNLWKVHQRHCTGDGNYTSNDEHAANKHFVVPMYKGARFTLFSLMSLHIFLHWAVTFIFSFLLVKHLSSFSMDTFLLAFAWITASYYSIGQVCSCVDSVSLLIESVRMMCFVCGANVYGEMIFRSSVEVSIVNTVVAILWALSMYTIDHEYLPNLT